jgi:hypothetical protein
MEKLPSIKETFNVRPPGIVLTSDADVDLSTPRGELSVCLGGGE